MATRAVPSKPPKGYISMDPNCAICRAPASMACECEARGLSLALQHAEDQVMRSKYDEIRLVCLVKITFVGISVVDRI